MSGRKRATWHARSGAGSHPRLAVGTASGTRTPTWQPLANVPRHGQAKGTARGTWLATWRRLVGARVRAGRSTLGSTGARSEAAA